MILDGPLAALRWFFVGETVGYVDSQVAAFEHMADPDLYNERTISGPPITEPGLSLWASSFTISLENLPRTQALEKLRAEVGGFTEEEYHHSLDDVGAHILAGRDVGRRLRDRMIALAGRETAANAVFILSYFNLRYPLEDNGPLQPARIDVNETLQAKFDLAELDLARSRANALVAAGALFPHNTELTEDELVDLSIEHPQFNDWCLRAAAERPHLV